MTTFSAADTFTQKLDKMHSWQDGWNGYTALAPRSTAIERAKAWLLEVETAIPASRWIEPLVSGTGDGGVSVHLSHGKRSLELDVDEQSIEGLQVWGEDLHAQMDDVEITSLQDVARLWDWLWEEEREETRV